MSILRTLDYRKLTKFIISGGLAAVTEYSSFFVLFNIAHLFLIGSNVASFLMGFVVSFTLNRSWLFKSNGGIKRQLTSYLILAVVNLVISNLLLLTLVHVLTLPVLIAKIISMILIAMWNYVFFSKLIFKK